MDNTPLIVIVGPSGSGKTTLCRMAEERLGLSHSISITTRPMRPHEVDGKDYFFIDVPAFKQKIKEGEFLEWAEVYGNFYGTSKKFVSEKLKQNIGLIMDLDLQGARSIRKLFKDALIIFVSAPSKSDLTKRLTARATDAEEVRKKRLDCSDEEEMHGNEFDHHLINDELDRAYKELEGVIKNRYTKL